MIKCVVCRYKIHAFISLTSVFVEIEGKLSGGSKLITQKADTTIPRYIYICIEVIKHTYDLSRFDKYSRVVF